MLENIPHIPGGFAVAELLAVVMFVALAFVTAFHKHRIVIMRRFFAITGSIFLLRCCTMLCTSLSVPGVHLECRGKVVSELFTALCWRKSTCGVAGLKLTWEGKIERIIEIITGFGMSVAGVKTCGDYMFSGVLPVPHSVADYKLLLEVILRRSHGGIDDVQFLSVRVHTKIMDGQWREFVFGCSSGNLAFVVLISSSTRCVGLQTCSEYFSFWPHMSITPSIASSRSTCPLVCFCTTTLSPT
jgi:hypothetical protein